MRILMVSNLPVDFDKITGGVESATINLLDGFLLLEDDIEVQVLSLNQHIDENTYYKNKILIMHASMSRLFAINYFKIKKLLNTYRPDIIHIQGSGPQLLNFLFFKNSNIVITQHGVMLHEYRTKVEMKDKFKFYLKYQIEKRIYPKYNNYIFISDYNKTLFPGLINKINISNIPNAIPFEYCDTYSNDLTNKYDILYLGGLYTGKNVILLIYSMKALLDEGIRYKLTIAGDFKEDKYKNTLSNAIKSMGMDNNVKFMGWVDKSKIRSLLKEHSIFVLPSNQEALPMSIAEAMATGRIVIATEVGGIPEMIQDKKTGFLFKKNNQYELMDILRNIHNDMYDLENIAKSAQKYAIEKYNPISIAKKSIQFYKNIILQS